jgi:hypothetical protein
MLDRERPIPLSSIPAASLSNSSTRVVDFHPSFFAAMELCARGLAGGRRVAATETFLNVCRSAAFETLPGPIHQ